VKDEPKRSIPPDFAIMMAIAYPGIFIVASLVISSPRSKFDEIWMVPGIHSDPVTTAFFVSRLLLFAVLAVLSYRWIHATYVEARMWSRWLDYRQEPEQGYLAMALLALLLGLLVGFADRIVIVSAILTASLLVNCWTQRLCNKYFAERLQHARHKYSGSSKKMHILDIMEYFWVNRPQLGRIVMMTVVSTVAFGLALAGALRPGPRSNYFYLAAYALLIIDIIVGETVVFIWRRHLDGVNKLAELDT
jgi:hypothetical protein